nr:hypothetical protein [Pandoravirus massiliensis]
MTLNSIKFFDFGVTSRLPCSSVSYRFPRDTSARNRQDRMGPELCCSFLCRDNSTIFAGIAHHAGQSLSFASGDEAQRQQLVLGRKGTMDDDKTLLEKKGEPSGVAHLSARLCPSFFCLVVFWGGRTVVVANMQKNSTKIKRATMARCARQGPVA